MSYQVDAIYDNGILKPLAPLALPDQARVTLTISAPSTPEASEKIAGQKAALQRLWEEVDKLPQVANNDGWSSREHDQHLYAASQFSIRSPATAEK